MVDGFFVIFKHRLLDENIFHHKQYSQYRQCGVELLPVGANHVDDNVGNDTAQDAVGDAVGERHHDDGDERRDCLGIVVEVDVLDRSEHEQTNDDEHRCGGSRRY